MDAVNQVVKRLVSELGADAGFRNRALATVVALTVLVGAFASGLEVSVRFGSPGQPELAQVVRPGERVSTSPSAPAGRPAPSPRAVPAPASVPPSVPAPVRVPAPAPAPQLDAPPAPTLPGAGDGADPAGGRSPDLPPPHVPDEDDERCIVTETVVLDPFDGGLDEGLDGGLDEVCAELSGEVDDINAGDENGTSVPAPVAGSTAQASPSPDAAERPPAALSVLWRWLRA